MVALGGALLGAAAALKLSNALLALVPALPLVLGCVTTTRQRLHAALVFAVCACGAALVITVPWALRLEQAFGNPFFPMLNDVFRAPFVGLGNYARTAKDYAFPDTLRTSIVDIIAPPPGTTPVDASTPLLRRPRRIAPPPAA